VDEKQVANLTKRVHALEQQIIELQERLGVPVEKRETPVVPPPVSVSPQQPPARPPAPPARPRDEVEVLGTWFARTGAVAMVIGLGFAFKYGVDRGYIGEAERVILGLLSGLALVGAAEWAHRRDWRTWAQAVAAAGIALGYLSILAGIRLYELISPAPGFAALVLVTVAGAALALRHESIALAVLASVGGYLNAVILSTDQPRPGVVFGYLLALDAGVIALAFVRRWRPLDATALVGTLIVFGVNASGASFGLRATFATLFLVLFVMLPFARLAGGRQSESIDLLLIGAAALVYFAYMLAILDAQGFEEMQGPLTLAQGAVYSALGFAVRRRDEPLSTGVLVLGLAAAAAFVPIQFEGEVVPAAWAAEGALLIAAGTTAKLPRVRVAGALLLLLALLAMPGAAPDLVPPRLLLSGQAASFVVVIASLAAAAWFVRRDPAPLPDGSAVVGALLALAVMLAWISAEVVTALDRAVATRQAAQFSLSAVWGASATVLFAVGLRVHAKWLRLAGAALFGLVLLKLAVADLWTLTTGYRVLAFVGLGIVLLACSLAYQRFRESILGED
jgi:uncharacterized membrane protein